ncbi:MAG: ComF family protein [Selenomonadaceae bacterium]|nr:ComF family protein [Selenomonadaceae bacterium]
MKFLRQLWEGIIFFLFPPRCPVCRQIVDERYQMCIDCEKKIMRLDVAQDNYEPIDKVLRVTKYREGSRELLRRLKFDNDLNVLPALKKILDDSINNEEIVKMLNATDFAVPVPLHQDRLKERGFNQTEEIFGTWLAKKNLQLRNILTRTRATEKLYSLGRTEREKVLRNAFAPIENENLSGKKVLIVDDIFTTGTTCKECAKVLKQMGAEKIFVLAFASDFGERKN